MQSNIFSPKIQGANSDNLSSFFKNSALVILSLTLALIPFWFVPDLTVTIGLVKTAIVIFGLYLVIILTALSTLRSGKINLYLPLPLIFFWLFTASTLVSAYLANDVFDSVFGDDFGVFTAGFTIVLAVIMTGCLLFVKNRKAILRMILAMLSVVLVVYLFTVGRLIGGVDFLSFNIFSSNTTSIIGGLNDLALYAGLVLLVVLVGIHRIPRNFIARVGVLVIVLASLVILAIVNFYFLWIIICLLSLVTFFYLIARDTWLVTKDEETPAVSTFVLLVVALIFITAGAFVVSGDYLGSKISTITGISYLEVRPSFSATTQIAKSVYADNIFTGGGTNRFEDAWRQFKNQTINETRFWNTNFNSGNSYIFTTAVNTGLLGIGLLLGFLLLFLRSCYRIIFTHKPSDKGWQTIGLVSVVSATYLWAITFWYTPNPTIMLLLALFTGLTIAVGQTLFNDRPLHIDVATSRPRGFVLIALVVFMVTGATVSLVSFKHYFSAQISLVSALADLSKTTNIDKYDQALATVSLLVPRQDSFLTERAKIRLTELNRLSLLSVPTTTDEQLFEDNLVAGIKLTEQAILLDRTNPVNYALLGSLYGFLNDKQYEGIAEKRDNAFATAKKLDPQNPEYDLLEAQIANRFGEIARARTKLTSAIALKGNYTDALFLSSQLDIQSGNATSAIATTEAIIKIEPDNPARYFQLGLLLLANANLPEAVTAFETAIVFDSNYANARYLLALTYLDLNRPNDALTQLNIVKITNQDNKTLTDLIKRIEDGDYTTPDIKNVVPVSEAPDSSLSDQADISKSQETNLISPVNTVPKSNSSVGLKREGSSTTDMTTD